MERVWSSMNSTRTWVTPPREPIQYRISLLSFCRQSIGRGYLAGAFEYFEDRGCNRTGTAEDAGDLDELDGLLGGIHFCDLEVVVRTAVRSRRIGLGSVRTCGRGSAV